MKHKIDVGEENVAAKRSKSTQKTVSQANVDKKFDNFGIVLFE